MQLLKTYIQQTKKNDNGQYVKGSVVDILSTYKIGTEDFPLVYLPEPQDLPTREWKDEDGEEVYVPTSRKFKAYEITVKFLYVGTEETFRGHLEGFIDFLYGRNSGATGQLLAIYDEHVSDGRKDITVKSVGTDLFFREDTDTEVIAEFSVTFSVHDPMTKVTCTKTKTGNTTTVALSW